MNVAASTLVALACGVGALAQSSPSQLEVGRKAIEGRAGCYLVDYSFVETDAIKPGYVRDPRVYDVNKEKSIKEWIYADEITPTRIRLQHVLFGTELSGKLMDGSLLKHTGEDWEFNAPFLYDFTGNATWQVKRLDAKSGQWTRRVTNLDDGLRYQCAAAWREGVAFADWTCSGLAPIPGRETRDMKRRDYSLLDRTSRIVVYDQSWLEREANTKIADENGMRTPLVKEAGKNWYVRLPDTECAAAQEFVRPRMAFWTIMRETWDEVLIGDSTFVERPKGKDEPSRYEQISDLEEKYLMLNLADPAVAKRAHDELKKVILAWRVESK